MKRILPLLIATFMVLSLCACQPKATTESTPPTAQSPTLESPSPDLADESEKTYKLLNYPQEVAGEDGNAETVYLTSVTFRKDIAIVTYLCRNKVDFPKLSVRMKDGREFALNPVFISAGAALFSVFEELPVSEIIEISCEQGVISLENIENHSEDAQEFYKEKLNGLSQMSYIELFSYCLGSDGAYSEGAYGELVKRMIDDPEEFALRLLAPTYPFAENAKGSPELADFKEEVFSDYRFDSKTELEICMGISSACLVTDVQKVIDTLNESGNAHYKTVADILTTVLDEIRLTK